MSLFSSLYFASSLSLTTDDECGENLFYIVLLQNCFPIETYHMIDRCDPEVATWSANGDNFVVKNVEKFATVSLVLVMPSLDIVFLKKIIPRLLFMIFPGCSSAIFQTFQLFELCTSVEFLWFSQAENGSHPDK